MITPETIKEIIYDGVMAPSGENCQPWRFVVHDNVIKVYNRPEADPSLYNFDQKGSCVAHGALIENMVISAAEHGYKTDVVILPGPQDPNLMSLLSFTESPAKKDPLYTAIAHRSTNRKEHKGDKLSEETKEKLIAAAKKTGLGELRLIDDESTKQKIGRALAVNEQVLFENQKLHQFFFDHIIWKDNEQGKANGFYIKTLEFLPHQLKGVKLFKKWGILNFLNKIGKVSRMIAKENAEKYARSAELAAVIVPGTSHKHFIEAGRIVERVWLTATSLGLAVHPCTGILYFSETIRGGRANEFSPEHQNLINRAYADLLEAFKASPGTIPMLFRIGYADPASARSLRMIPEIEFK